MQAYLGVACASNSNLVVKRKDSLADDFWPSLPSFDNLQVLCKVIVPLPYCTARKLHGACDKQWNTEGCENLLLIHLCKSFWC